MAEALGSGTQALERGLSLLRDVAVSDTGGVRLTDLIGRSGLSRSTTHRLLAYLVREEFLHKDPAGSYHLGRGAYDIGLLATHRYEMSGISREPLRLTAARLGDALF